MLLGSYTLVGPLGKSWGIKVRVEYHIRCFLLLGLSLEGELLARNAIGIDLPENRCRNPEALEYRF